jgi:hypothetical protein
MKTMMIAAALALCACASDPHEEMRADAKHVDSLAHELAQEAQGYCAAAPWTTPAACVDAVVSHREAIAACIGSLMQMADRMDGHLRDVGSDVVADTLCGLPAVQGEMDRYESVSCGAADPAAAESALEHCGALIDAAAQAPRNRINSTRDRPLGANRRKWQHARASPTASDGGARVALGCGCAASGCPDVRRMTNAAPRRDATDPRLALSPRALMAPW